MKKSLIIEIFDISDIKRISFREDINGLRAIAVLSVVFYHADFFFVKGGWLGVDIFFVISGYLISNIIISELNEQNFTFRNFYLKRVRRILPALISIILISLPFAYWLLTPGAVKEFSKSTLSSVFFYSNYYFQNLDFYNAEPTKQMPLLHTWSLSIEEQFYIIFPILCLLIFKSAKKYFVVYLSVLLLISIFLNSTTSELLKFYQIQYRGWELLLGSLTMIVQNKIKINNLSYIGIAFITYSLLYFDDSIVTLNSIEPRIVALLGTSMMLINSGDNFVTKMLSTRYISRVGQYSYSLYLIHQPLFAFYFVYRNKYFDTSKDVSLFILFIVLFILSYINWKFVEVKFQIIKLKKLFLILFICIFVILLFITISEFTNGFEYRFSHVPENVLFYSLNTNLYPSEQEIKNFNNFCVNDRKKESLLIIGDSNINTFTYTLFREYKNLSCNFEIEVVYNPAGRCLLSQQTDSTGEVFECSDQYFEEFLKKIRSRDASILAIGRFDAWLLDFKGGQDVYCKSCDYKKVYANRLNEISKASKKLYLVEPIPVYPIRVADSYLNKNHEWGEEITISYSSWLNYISETKYFLDDINLINTQRLSPEEVFCNSEVDKCYASSSSEIYYSDTNHLTVEGNMLLIDYIFSNILENNN